MRYDMTTYKNDFVPGSTGDSAIDAVWVVLCTFIIFTMQTGFGLLESGTVLSIFIVFTPFLKHTWNIEYKINSIRKVLRKPGGGR